MLGHIVILFLISRCCSAVIYSMNESEYNRLPALFHLDAFEPCLAEPEGTYCVMDMDLFSTDNSELMRTLQEYSAHTVKHFNHTQIHRGVCVTNTCKQFLNNTSTDKDEELSGILEACLNESLWINYKIQGKLSKLRYCKRANDRVTLDSSDIAVAVVYILLIMLNVAGSLYDVLILKDDKPGNPYLLAFSLRRNWDRLIAPVDTEREPRLERLKLFHGMRTITMLCVIFSHTMLAMAFAFVDNPLYIEKSYEDPMKQLLYNGSLVTHTFFVMSSFLMAYNLSLYAEKQTVNWLQWPKGILMRWLRLTPTYALILATICTWMRYAGTGPMWDLVVTSEADACRQYWWAHVFYINNYVYNDAYCAPETWYLAADTQLFCIGLLVCVLFQKPKARVAALVVLFVLSLLISAAHTYFQDLNAIVIQAPEAYRNLYERDDTFRLQYIRGHTNLSTYTLGLAGGFLTYYCQTENKDMDKYKKYRWAFWLFFPLAVGVILSGGLFYTDGGVPSTALRVLYATFYKPLFQLLIVIFIIGCVFKLDTLYRGIVEWRGFTWTGRASYSAFLLHTLFQRGLVGAYQTPVHMSDYFAMVILSGSIFITYVCSAALWLLVEAPFAGVIRTLQHGGKREGAGEEGVGEPQRDRSKV